MTPEQRATEYSEKQCGHANPYYKEACRIDFLAGSRSRDAECERLRSALNKLEAILDVTEHSASCCEFIKCECGLAEMFEIITNALTEEVKHE